MMRLTRDQARRVLVATQGLDRRPAAKPSKSSVLSAIRRMGVLQIDTIHIVARSPYLVLWSRLGEYEPRWLDELLEGRQLFEYWAHEASFLPIEDYGLFRHRMIDPGGMGWKYSHDWIDEHRNIVDSVLERVRNEGATRSVDFVQQHPRSAAGWWSWKPEKRALEMLFTSGHLMVAKRERFQRVYDLRERVHPDWNDVQLSEPAAAHAELISKAAWALGVATSRWLADYYRMSRRETDVAIVRLLADGLLTEVTVDRLNDVAYVHSDRTQLLDRARRGGIRPTLTTVLSPFDPLVWDRARALELFDFDYRLECYVPASRRRWGYFMLPILSRGRLVGRVDAKAHRADGRFEVIALFIEEGITTGDVFTRDLARALADVAAWHGTPDVDVVRTQPRGYARMLRGALTELAG